MYNKGYVYPSSKYHKIGKIYSEVSARIIKIRVYWEVMLYLGPNRLELIKVTIPR
jgi:hypothetical protein